jgi:SAM-dependent methyltransferase
MNAMSESGVFGDQIAAHYDVSRALTDDSMGRLVDVLQAEIAGRDPCLEVGVGTGLVALPLAAAGVRMVGIDASAAMLGQLLAKGRGSIDLLRADAVALPFADASFGAGLLFHVLHLVPEWELALRELARVLRRPGLLIVKHSGGAGDPASSPQRQIRTRFHEEAGVRLESVPGLRDPDDVDAVLGRIGGRPRELPPIVARRTSTVRQVVDLCESGTNSSNAHLPAELRSRAAAVTRAWASERFGGLDVEISEEYGIVWRAYDLD